MLAETISHYRVIRKLGQGGMGVVYLAQDTQLNRPVAVKLLPENSLANPQARQRLVREARAAAQLDHPNICSIYEIGEAGGQTFIAMQYVEGETLADRCSRANLLPPECLETATQIAEALSEAHAKGIIHRDIKPQNIMLAQHGPLKVLDFGLAKSLPPDLPATSDEPTQSCLTTSRVIVGTVPYLSPEQLEGKSADGRSDIFSLGVVIYEMLTGQQPFAANSQVAIMTAILTREPEPLSRYMADVPAELERIVQKCLEKDRERRYQSARELALDLRKLRESLQADARGKTERLRLRRWRWAAMLALALLLLVIAILGVDRLASRNKAAAKPIASIAVLPFANDGTNLQTDYLSDGITEGLINSLSQLPNLKVIARNSAFRFKGQEVDVADLGRELNVEAVLTGRVRQLGDELSISAELTDARDKRQLWGAQYSRKLSDIFALQEELSREISERLRLKLSGEQSAQLAKHYTDNFEAYDLYLKGRQFWNRRTTEDLTKAIEYFKQALTKDPAYALAYAGLADSYSLLGDYAALPAREAFMQAKAAANDAIRLDSTLAEAYTALAHTRLYDWDWTSADEEYRRAIELNPNYATARQWYANHLVAMGRMDEARAEIQRAMDLDPLSLIISEAAGRQLYLMRQYDQAIEQQRKVLALEPNFIPAHAALGLAYAQKGSYEQAVNEFKKAFDLSGNPAYMGGLAYAYAVSSQRRKAQEVFDSLTSTSKRRYISPYVIAMIHMGLGEDEQALNWLEKAFDDRTSELMFLKQEPVFDALHTQPRFQNLLHRIGLP